MNKFFQILVFLTSTTLLSQINYQSVVKYSNGQLVSNKMIAVRFSITLGSDTGTVVYSEMQNPSTNAQGIISTTIGNGIPQTGVFSQINWSQGSHYLKAEFYTGPFSCEWLRIPFGENGPLSQIISSCSGTMVIGPCSNFNTLVWSDEFNTNGTVDNSKWHHQTQLPIGNTWYNGEVQHYTNRQINSFVSNGNLIIAAKKETYTDQGVTKEYTSARLNSKFTFKYGKVEVRAKLPSGEGTWPAIWTLGKNIIEPGAFWSASHGAVYWPYCGEIDIMEHWGNNQNYVQSAIHTPSSYGGTINIGGQNVSTASSQFHVYTLVWTSEKLTFSVDGIVHYVYNPTIKDANTWPFDAEQYLLLNVAMQPAINPLFVQSTMEVDYVRIYQ